MVASAYHDATDNGNEATVGTLVERMSRLLDACLQDPATILDAALGNSDFSQDLMFDHAGCVIAHGATESTLAALRGTGFVITAQFQSVVIAGYLREVTTTPNLGVQVLILVDRRQPRRVLELFVPDRNLPASIFEHSVSELAHLAFKPTANADFDTLARRIERAGCHRFLRGTNPHQVVAADSAGIRTGGVSLHYFKTASPLFGQVKLELTTGTPTDSIQAALSVQVGPRRHAGADGMGRQHAAVGLADVASAAGAGVPGCRGEICGAASHRETRAAAPSVAEEGGYQDTR
jgi:hypothetical protein